MASHRPGECPERGSEATESKGDISSIAHLVNLTLNLTSDDGIVVAVWFVYILRRSDGSSHIGQTSHIDARRY